MLGRALLLIALTLPLPALAQLRWEEGKHYLKVTNPQTAETVVGKIEVAEVFSYACNHCNEAQANVEKLKASLPADAYMTYVHASFVPATAWPMFQRAYYTALSMGIAAPNHRNMFVAVWDTGEIPLVDKATGRIHNPLPTIQQAARFYARVGKVKEADFLSAAQSFGVESQIKRADALIAAWRVGGTPTIVVNGRYVINNDIVKSWNDTQSVVAFLITQERQRMKTAASPTKPGKP
jgi:protein dithiol oxidoreductase (disulfide-forming)